MSFGSRRRPNGKCDSKAVQSDGKREKVVGTMPSSRTPTGYIKEGNRDREMVLYRSGWAGTEDGTDEIAFLRRKLFA